MDMNSGGGLPDRMVGAGWREAKGEKYQDNCNSIPNEIFLKIKEETKNEGSCRGI